MADEADVAQKIVDLNLEIALSKRAPALPKGNCHNCKEVLPKDKSFCDQDCEDDFNLRQKHFAR